MRSIATHLFRFVVPLILLAALVTVPQVLLAAPLLPTAQSEEAPQQRRGDRDGDGVRDDLDRCLRQPETRNGVFDGDGCPDTIDDLIEFVANDLDTYWAEVFAENGLEYVPPGEFRGYSRPIRTACGRSIPNNAFYCPLDHGIYYDINLMNMQLNEQGDFAPVVILAHEWAHLLQALIDLQSQAPGLQAIQRELQADCLAGAYAWHTEEEGYLEEGDMEEGTRTLFLFGDAENLPGFDPRAHGTPEQRANAFERGWEGGIQACFP